MADKVYVLKAQGKDLFKIGYTTGNPVDRLKTLQTGCPFRLQLHRVLERPDAADLEKQLHAEFADERTHGEWFAIEAQQLDKRMSGHDPALSKAAARAARTPHDHDVDQTVSELRESAYRRGFQQGATRAFLLYDAACFPPKSARDWMEAWLKTVAMWRHRLDDFEEAREMVTPPPEPENAPTVCGIERSAMY